MDPPKGSLHYQLIGVLKGESIVMLGEADMMGTLCSHQRPNVPRKGLCVLGQTGKHRLCAKDDEQQ